MPCFRPRFTTLECLLLYTIFSRLLNLFSKLMNISKCYRKAHGKQRKTSIKEELVGELGFLSFSKKCWEMKIHTYQIMSPSLVQNYGRCVSHRMLVWMSSVLYNLCLRDRSCTISKEPFHKVPCIIQIIIWRLYIITFARVNATLKILGRKIP